MKSGAWPSHDSPNAGVLLAPKAGAATGRQSVGGQRANVSCLPRPPNTTGELPPSQPDNAWSPPDCPKGDGEAVAPKGEGEEAAPNPPKAAQGVKVAGD